MDVPPSIFLVGWEILDIFVHKTDIYIDAYSVFYVSRISFHVTRLISVIFTTFDFIETKNISFGNNIYKRILKKKNGEF